MSKHYDFKIFNIFGHLSSIRKGITQLFAQPLDYHQVSLKYHSGNSHQSIEIMSSIDQ